jgi:SnoaL-like domain
VTEPTTPLAIAIAFTKAWTSHDMETAASYVAEDVEFDGPIAGHTTGIDAYMQGLSAFAPVVTGMRIIAAFGDDTQALIMYDLTTAPFGTLRTAELLTVKDGKIQEDKLTFDTYKVRQASAGQPPSAAPTE